MITVTCTTTDQSVLLIVSQMYAELAENAAEATTTEATADMPVDADPAAAVVAAVASASAAAAEAPPLTEDPVLSEDEIKDIAASVPAPGVELDSEGLPWDERLHVSTKTKRQSDDTWKLKRGVAGALVDKVKAELKNLMAVAAPAASPVGEAPAAEAPPVADAAPVAEAPPVTDPAAVAPVADPAPTTFPTLLQAFTKRQQAGKITTEEVDAICVGHGIASIALIASRPDLIPAVFESMEALCLTRP